MRHRRFESASRCTDRPTSSARARDLRRGFLARVWSFALAAVISIAVSLGAGCGAGNDEPADRAFGGLADSDISALREWSRGLAAATDAQADMIRAFQEEDVDAARAHVDELLEVVADARRSTIDFDSGELRSILQGYLRPIARYGAAADRFIRIWEEEEVSGVFVDEQTVNDLLRDIEHEGDAVQESEERLMNRLLDVMSTEQKAEFRREYRDRIRAFEERATPDPMESP